MRVRRSDGVAWVTLDNPPLNVLTAAVLGELADALGSLQADRELRLIVLEGAGRVFSAGADVGEHLGDLFATLMDRFGRVAHALLESEVPTLAVVQGAALGGGCELAVLCDLVIAAEDARLGVPEITLGVVPPVAAALFPRVVGPQRAAGLILTGTPVSGAEAAAWGLVWKSVPADRLRAEAEAIAATFAARSAAALRLARRALIAGRLPSLVAAVDAADELSKEAVPAMADAQEGLRAFLEKRPPRWVHR